MRGESFWNERVAAAALLVGVIMSVAGIAFTTSLRMYLFGPLVIAFGAVTCLAALAAYRS
jgi:hypothetical protein